MESIALDMLTHLYVYAEVYTILLVWIAVPLGYFAVYLFLSNHVDILIAPKHRGEKRGTDR